jgi:hypothetical protein
MSLIPEAAVGVVDLQHIYASQVNTRNHPATPPPVHVLELNPEAIHTDPSAYQFRSGGDLNGVTDKGRIHANHWDATKYSDPIIVHQRLNGAYYVADGHHRLDLAKRTNAMGTGPGKLKAYVLREADGYTTEDVKIIAAEKNIGHDLIGSGHSTGDIVDGARVFKEARRIAHPQWLPSLQMDKGDLHLSYTLSALSNASLNAVAQQQVPVKTAAAIAESVRDTSEQDRVIQLIGGHSPYEIAMHGEGGTPIIASRIIVPDGLALIDAKKPEARNILVKGGWVDHVSNRSSLRGQNPQQTNWVH